MIKALSNFFDLTSLAFILATAASIISEVRISNGWTPKMRKKSTWHDRISQKEAVGTEKIN